MVRYYMHRPSAVDKQFSARSCPYCLDDEALGVCCDDGYIGMNDGFCECDISRGGGRRW